MSVVKDMGPRAPVTRTTSWTSIRYLGDHHADIAVFFAGEGQPVLMSRAQPGARFFGACSGQFMETEALMSDALTVFLPLTYFLQVVDG